jgi:hypothetical protein
MGTGLSWATFGDYHDFLKYRADGASLLDGP